ncbi:MAG: hypothetical protein AAGI63_14530, partial [Planctomycetota bacterium]
GFFFADVLIRRCFEDPFPAMLALGVVTAQLTVICVWGTLVRGTFWIRLPWTLLLLVVSWCGIAWGINLHEGRTDVGQSLGAAVFWAFGFITSFIPLKIAAICFRWQIVQDDSEANGDEQKSSYAIRDIMLGTFLLAISMGVGRVMLRGEDDVSLLRAIEESELTDTTLLFATTLYGVISLAVKLPCIWIALGEKIEKIPSRVGVWAVYCFLLTIVELALLTVALGDPGPGAVEIFGGIILSHQLMGAIMLAVCLALRGLGYRLERSISGKPIPAIEIPEAGYPVADQASADPIVIPQSERPSDPPH